MRLGGGAAGRLLLATLLALVLAACMMAGAGQAHAASNVNVALTVIDATDGTVVCNDKVEGLTDANTVADLLAAAGFEQVDTWSQEGQYTVSNGAPYFLGKGYDANSGSYWQTLYNGSSNTWANAMIEATDWNTGEKSTPTLQDGGHYQYIYGNGTQELAPANPETYEVTFTYGLHELADPLALVNNTFTERLCTMLQARFSTGGADAAIDNMTFIAAPALALMGQRDAIDAQAIVGKLDAERSANTLSAGRLAKYIIALTAAGKDCTSVMSGGKLANLVSEMEGLMSANESVYNAVLILPAYRYGGYSMANSPATETALIETILASQAKSGLFGGEYASTQLTGEALLALQPYAADNPQVASAIKAAVRALWTMQNSDGGFRYDATQDFSDVNATGEAVAGLSGISIDAGGATSNISASDQGVTPASYLFGAADVSQDGYKQLAESLGYNEPMMAAYAFAGITAYRSLALEKWGDGYLYAPVSTTPDSAADAVWERLGGPVALDTMSLIVDEGGFATGGTVVLATMGGYWDALTAAGVAGMAQAPVLLTKGDALSAQTKAQLERLKPAKVIVCGGPMAITDAVVSEAGTAAGGAAVVRMAGTTAVGTANDIFAKAAKETGGSWAASKTAFLCTSATFQDALAAAPLSYALHMPIFLTDNATTISAETLKAMADGGISKVVIVGGTEAIAPSVEQALQGAKMTVEARLGGDTSIETSELVAGYGLEHGMVAQNMGAATYREYYDALAGAALCGKNNAVLVLVGGPQSHSIGGFVAQHANDIWNGYVFGGPAAVDEPTAQALAQASKMAKG